MSKPSTCPSCDYTKRDQQINWDHHLCKNAGKAPWEKKPEASPAPQPEPTPKKYHCGTCGEEYATGVPCDLCLDHWKPAEQPAPPAGARELTPETREEREWMRTQHLVPANRVSCYGTMYQRPGEHLITANVGGWYDTACYWRAEYETFEKLAASERARADAAERDAKDAKLAYGKLFNENCAHLGEIDELRRNAVTLSARVRGKTAEVDSLRSELREAREARDMLRRERKGEVWRWQDDPDDHPESLNCPVLVQADVIRRFVAAEAQLRDMREALTGAFNAAETFRKPCPTDIEWTAAIESLIKAERLLSRKEDKAQ